MNAKKQRNILIIVILVLLGGLGLSFNYVSSLKTKIIVADQNNKALNDSIRTMDNKLNETEYAKNILISDKKNLKELNSDLAEELTHEKGKVRELTKFIAEMGSTDTVYVTNTLIEYPDGTNGLEWNYDTIYDSENERHLAGISKFKIDTNGLIIPLQTEITKDIIRFNIVQGLRELDGNIEIFVRSDYPGFEIKELSSAIIDPKKHPVLKKFTKKKKIGVGPYIGVGFGGSLKPSLQVGIGVHYDFIQF